MKILAKQRLQASEIAPEARSIMERVGNALRPVKLMEGKKAMNIKKVSAALQKVGIEVKVVSDLYRQTAAAWVSINERNKLYINELCEYWKYPELIIRKRYESGHISTGDDLHVIYHECAHMAHMLTNREWEGDEQKIASRVSKYATENRNEFIAEYSAAVMLGKHYDKEVDALYNKLMTP